MKDSMRSSATRTGVEKRFEKFHDTIMVSSFSIQQTDEEKLHAAYHASEILNSIVQSRGGATPASRGQNFRAWPCYSAGRNLPNLTVHRRGVVCEAIYFTFAHFASY